MKSPNRPSIQRDSLEDIFDATESMAHLATLMRWSGTALKDGMQPPSSAVISEIGLAMTWAGQMIAEQCNVICEAISSETRPNG